jgi:hypothetical protein
MEDVLEVYQRPHDPARPVVCLDETSKQLIAETRVPIPAKPGHPARVDYEYERNGTANLFMLFAPLEGWRHVKVTDRHAAADYAQVLKAGSDSHFPGADKIILVQDNLSTHKPASLYEAFPPAKPAGSWNGSSGIILHAQARKLAGHGRVRTQCAVKTMPGPANPRQTDADPRGRRMAAEPQQKARQGRLAVHQRGRPRQAQAALPQFQ